MKKAIGIILIISVLFFVLSYFGWQSFKKNESELMGKVLSQNVTNNLNQMLPEYGLSIIEEGVPVLVNVWATWCGPCIQEIPEMNEIVEEYKNSPVRFLAFSDESPDLLEQLKSKKAGFEFKYELAFEARQIINYLSTLDIKNKGQSIPIHILIKSDGTLEELIVGASDATILKIRSFLKENDNYSPI